MISRDHLGSVGRPWLRRLFLVFVGFAAALLALELPALFGWIDYRYTIGVAVPLTGGDSRGMDAHAHVHHSLTGDLVPFYSVPDPPPHPIEFDTDSNGFRNPIDRTQVDLVILGDSFVQNSDVRDEDTFPRQLEQKLGISVANLGFSGWGPSEELDVFQRVGVALQPRLAVWTFYEGNDLGDLLQHPLASAPWYDSMFVPNAFVRLAKLYAELAWPYTNYWVKDGGTSGSCTLRCPAPPCTTMYMGQFADRLTGSEEFALRRTFDILEEAQLLAGARGIKLYVAFAPVKLRVYRAACDFEPTCLAASSHLNQLPERMSQWAASHKIEFVDLTPALQQAAERGEAVYWPEDTHWNARGNAVVAEVLAQRLLSFATNDHSPSS